MIKARVLLARGGETDAQSALDILDALCEIAGRTYNTRCQIEIMPLRALALDALGRAGDAQAALRHAVELSRPGGFIRPFVDLGQPMADMLGRLAAQGVAVETVRRILAAFPIRASRSRRLTCDRQRPQGTMPISQLRNR